MDTTLRLNRFYENRTRLGRHESLYRGQIVEVGEVYAREKRLKTLVILGLTRGGNRADRATVKGIVHGDETILSTSDSVPPLASKLERRFPRLSAAVAEEDPIGERTVHQRTCQPRRGERVVEIGHMHQLPRLYLDRLEHVIVTVSESVDRQTADEVQVSIAIEIEQIHTVAAL